MLEQFHQGHVENHLFIPLADDEGSFLQGNYVYWNEQDRGLVHAATGGFVPYKGSQGEKERIYATFLQIAAYCAVDPL